ncbi:hypothetical protein PFICI_02031 [Pestalotiopsis fici W106-1]|uniref:Uncharacterized protein n=1 Tax=Pestalotiopsis fici (strain W106-1 / CGMCC3.15140) TaxID=1229662 RepID=W3XQ80_PESFW|nr:uncharacterized protein PFICI_02031 [Pestalotiopsis fici W106-1]ETS88203.1 hypothetical protein PFICI_02031 [Pestalotiopsis fici W106-1]
MRNSKQLRRQNIIPSNVRFQVCLPPPYNVQVVHCKHKVVNAIEPLYEQRFEETIDRIVAGIPHDDMGGPLQGLLDRVARLCRRIPQDVNIAFHLCYGDLYHKHFVEPQDTALPVKLTNAILARDNIALRTEWIHLPVPKGRTDPEYFSPLAGLELHDHIGQGQKPPRLYLGLVHANDEVGTRKRIEMAEATVPFPFGVATECGLGRTPGEIDNILQICKDVSIEIE